MKTILFMLALASLIGSAFAWSDDQMLYFSEISYKVGSLSAMAEDAKLMYSSGVINFTTYKTIVEGANQNIRFYNLLLSELFNSTIAMTKKKSEYAI